MGTYDKSKNAIEGDLADMLRAARLEAERVGPTGPDIRPLPASQLEEPIDVPADENELAMPAPDVTGFNINREIGSGGQATVFEATQNSTGQKVAIKVMPGGRLVGARRRERFDREARVLSALTHPNVVGIIDRGSTADGSLYLVMDYIDGRQLDEYAIAARTDALPGTTARLLRIFVKICEAVADAHAKGIVHRDLKPSNIRVDRGGEPHVLDFGLARVLGPEPHAGSITLTGQVLGSLPWASPEQVSGGANDVDARSDVYSLGVMLYQLLTGEFPYSVSGTIPQVAENILRARPKSPKLFRGMENTIGDSDLDAIALKALAKMPDARYATARDLGRELESWLIKEPRALTTSPAKQRRFSRRAVSVMMCVALLAASGIGIHLHRLRTNSSSRQDASRNPEMLSHSGSERASSSPRSSTGTPSQLMPDVKVVDNHKSTTVPEKASRPLITNSIGIQLASIPAGHFVMGSPKTEQPRQFDEDQHTVFITRDFYIGTTAVTRGQYLKVIGNVPGDEADDDVPVTFVTWADAHQFCDKLTAMDNHHYRLPTEAEWEYACRAGTTTLIGGTGRIDDMAWYYNDSKKPMPVGTKTPNAWGLYDMHGNVAQYCEDHYRGKYPTGPVNDPLNIVPSVSNLVVTRGGDFTSDLKSCRSAARLPRRPDSELRTLGFRVVMDMPVPPAVANDPSAR